MNKFIITKQVRNYEDYRHDIVYVYDVVGIDGRVGVWETKVYADEGEVRRVGKSKINWK